MAQTLATYTGDRRMTLANGEVIRAPIYGSTWSTIRICLQATFEDPGAGVSGTPRLAFGVCRGDTAGFGSNSTLHALGCCTNNATWTRVTGPPVGFSISSSRFMTPFKKIGSTLTITTPTASVGQIPASTSVRTLFFLEIVKGSPYKVRVCSCTSTNYAADVGDTLFAQVMELGPLTSAAALNALGGAVSAYGYDEYTVTVDEVTNGALDYIFVYWERTSFKFSFNIRHRKVA